ncbi:unnamed protein product, partial [Musa textilis]
MPRLFNWEYSKVETQRPGCGPLLFIKNTAVLIQRNGDGRYKRNLNIKNPNNDEKSKKHKRN